jgi:hypothetical protein
MTWLKNNWFKILFLLFFAILLVICGFYTAKYMRVVNQTAYPIEPKIVQVITSTSTAKSQKSLDLPAIIQEWYSGVVRIECYSRNEQGKLSVQSGSGLLVQDKDGMQAFTNQHVISAEKNMVPELCTVKLANNEEPYIAQGMTKNGSKSEIFISQNNLDWGYIKITYPDTGFKQAALRNIRFCSKKADLGTGVVVMAYPQVGSGSDVTVTQGIISGYENYYYITDAKIGEGSSGGAAIQFNDDPKKSCLLGIPTYAQIGEVVNLGRILDIQQITEDPAFNFQ